MACIYIVTGAVSSALAVTRLIDGDVAAAAFMLSSP